MNRRRLQQLLELALSESSHAKKPCALTVLLVDDNESARLHALHFKDPTPTDVMTFPDGTVNPRDERLLLGDLAVGIDVARREAAIRKRSVGDEVTLYILHGLLHLLDYDDQTTSQQRRMWKTQKRLLEKVGIDLEDMPS